MFSYVGGDDDSTSVAAMTLTWPTVDASDQALLWWTGQTGLGFTGPTGFTLVEAFVADSGSHESRLYRKTCTGSEDGTSITLTMGGANKHSATLSVYRGVSTSAPIHDYDAVNENSGTGSHPCPPVTPTIDGCAAVAACSERFSSGTTNFTPPPGYTERQEVTSQGGGGATFLSTCDDGLSASHPAGDAVSPGSFTGGAATDNVVTWTVLLTPATQTITVDQATETDTAFGLPVSAAAAQATETDESLDVTAKLQPAVVWSIAIDWDGDGDYTTDGDDVTSRTLERAGLSMQYGRDQDRELSPMAAGAADMELDNTSKDYSPDNIDSPLYGKVVPARPVRMAATASGVEHVLFTGFIDGYDVKPAIGERSVDISALDAVAKLKGAKATTQLYAGIRTGTAIGYVLDAIGWPDDLRDLDPGATVVRWWWVEDEDAFEAIQKLVQSEGPPAMLTSDEQGRIVFRDRHHRLLAPAALTPRQTFIDDSPGPAFTGFTYDHGWGDIVNSVRVKVDELDPAVFTETVWESADTRVIGADSTISISVTLDDPVVDPDVAFTVSSGEVTGEIVQESGQTLTVKLTSADTSASIRDLAVIGRPVAARRSYTILTEDDPSIDDYGQRSLEYEVPWAGVNDAGAVAQLILDASAQRRPIVTITLRSKTRRTSTRLVEQLSRDLSDRVHIREPQTCVDHDFHIERIEHKALEAGLVLETTFGMERALTQAGNVFRFDDDAHGFDDGVFASVGLADPETVFRFDVDGRGFDDGAFVA